MSISNKMKYLYIIHTEFFRIQETKIFCFVKNISPSIRPSAKNTFFFNLITIISINYIYHLYI